jgi:predicted hydrocarbon binding protein
MARWPRGYVGKDHETIGSDILAVERSLRELVKDEASLARTVEQIVGGQARERLSMIKPEEWYPIAWLLEMMESMDKRLGRFGLIKMGRALFKLSHEARIAQMARSGRDIVEGIDQMYHHANRGQSIGGWRVVKFDVSGAELEKTTPHHCAMEEGILAQALTAVGAPSVVSQSACFREGAEACRFVITPTSAGARWA